MECVGAFLQQEALKRHGAEYDSFGRSSFNRYYYAAFLEVRTVLRQLSPKWGHVAHKNIPELLTGDITKALKKGLALARKTDDRVALPLCSTAVTAARDLAALMTQAYASRVVADYEAEVRIVPGPAGDYKLNEVFVSIAKAWPHKARTLSGSIGVAWQQLDG